MRYYLEDGKAALSALKKLYVFDEGVSLYEGNIRVCGMDQQPVLLPQCTKMIITGDLTQIDLPSTAKSGLVQAMQILRNVKGISQVEFDKRDIVRHRLVQRIVEAYDAAAKDDRETNRENNE